MRARAGLAGVLADDPPTCGGRTATIVGTEGPDDLLGTPGDDVVWVTGSLDSGSDLIRGGAGADRAYGGTGRDRCSAEIERSC